MASDSYMPEPSENVESEGNLLVLVIDVNPDQRAFLAKSPQRLTKWIDSGLALVNSHLLLHPSNEVAVVAASKRACKFLYPDGTRSSSSIQEETITNTAACDGQFEGFRNIEKLIRQRAYNMIAGELRLPTEPNQPFVTPDSLVAGGLCMALSYINRRHKDRELPSISDKTSEKSISKGTNDLKDTSNKINARILVMTASGSAATQYMNYMNAFFTSQKMNIPVDTCMLDRDSSLLQQGADITGGLYVKVPNIDSLFQFLVWIFLPDASSLRKQMGMPSAAKVDYRAACFCHRQLVDVGFVCSVCLSIYCRVSPICTTCHTNFKMPGVPGINKKKKK